MEGKKSPKEAATSSFPVPFEKFVNVPANGRDQQQQQDLGPLLRAKFMAAVETGWWLRTK